MGIDRAVNALAGCGQWAFWSVNRHLQLGNKALTGVRIAILRGKWALTELSMPWLDAVNGHSGASIDID